MDARSVRKREEILGKQFKTNKCGDCVVIDYTTNRNVKVAFLSPHFVTKCNLEDLKKGKVSNPLCPTLYGKGFIGIGEYSSRNKGAYDLWLGMFKRVYDLNYHKRQPTYSEVMMCKEWHNFQNFAKWCYSQEFFNARDENGKAYQLDKDILVKGSKIYSPETCCFVPSCINKLIQTDRSNKGEYPTGVCLHKKSGKFLSYLNRFGVHTHLGYFLTSEDASKAYVQEKEIYVKDVAEKWKGRIDDKVYKHLSTWSMGVDFSGF